jgi:uncharacterized pyridoxamine 5'-phosphate oxidase family protein
MQEIVDFIKKSQVQYFATVGTDGKPKVRPFQFMMENEGKLYFCTSNQKNVFKEMQKQPHVELCASGESFSWLRLSGKAVFSDDLAIKAKIMEVSPMVKSIYNSPDNPAFEAFYLANAVATFADFSGNPPRTITL